MTQAESAEVIDANLEERIESARLCMQFAKNRNELQAAWDELKTLHSQRSQERIAQMEIERGLR